MTNEKLFFFRHGREHDARRRDAAFLRALRDASDEELKHIANNHRRKNAPEWKKVAIYREISKRLETAPTIPVPPHRTWRCIDCGGAAHPATGCVYSENAISCWRCTERFWAWVQVHTNKKARRRRSSGQPQPDVCFYEAATKFKDRA